MQASTESINWPEAVIKHLIDAVVAMDDEGVIRHINPAALKFAEHSPLAEPGQSAAKVFKFLDAEKRDAYEVPIAESFRNRVSSRVLSGAVFVSPSGKERFVNAIFTPIREDHGAVTGIVLRFRDITQAVMRDREMWDMQKIQVIGNMAGSIANEFINWLGIISGHAAAIVDSLIPRTRAYEEAVSILAVAKQAGGLTRRLLSVARASRTDGELQIESIDLGAILRSSVNQAQNVFGTDTVKFKVRHAETVPAVLADGAQLVDCLLNLFRNAVEAMPDGGTITVDFPKSTSASHQGFVILRIRDKGSGMGQDVLKRAFDPFFSTKSPASSMGLGLTVVHTSVEHWGGFVKIRSRPERGTSVRLFLPLAGEVAPWDHGTPAESRVATVLIVDDNEDILEQTGTILKTAGYQVHTAHSADDCLSAYRRHADEIDVVIIDVVMPGTDGKSILREILRLDPQASVIMTSGFSREYVRGYLKRGVWGFVQKPIDHDYLLATVKKMLKEE